MQARAGRPMRPRRSVCRKWEPVSVGWETQPRQAAGSGSHPGSSCGPWEVRMRRLIPLLGLCGALAAPGLGETYVVYPDAHMGDFPNIQAAVDNVVDGDSIELADGVFRGLGNRDVDYLGKEITIRSQSADPRVCVVDCEGGYEEHRGFVFTGVTSEAMLEGITVRNGYHMYGGAIYCGEDASPTIARCIFERNVAQAGGGIHCAAWSSPLLSECTFVENLALDMGGGVCT